MAREQERILAVEKFSYQDSIRLGQQRPRVSGRFWGGAFWGLVIEASAASILYALYEGFQLFMR